MSDLIMGQSAQVLIDEIARLQAVLKAHRDMLMRLYQDTVPPSGHCYRCGLWAGEHDENCAMAEVEELLALEFEGRRMTMSGMTSERLEELRRIAQMATPGPWGMNPETGLVDEAATLTPVCGMVWVRTEEQTLANAKHIAAFDPTTCLALLDEIERLRREREAALDILSREDIGDGAKVEGVRLILKGGWQ